MSCYLIVIRTYQVADWIMALDGKKMLPAQITEVMMNNFLLFFS